MSDRPTIIVHGFETTYKTDASGKTVAIDWVSYSPIHSALLSLNKERVDFLDPAKLKNLPDDEQGSKKLDFFRWRWDQIQRAYKAWKEGTEIPVDGTPLAAWPGLNKAQADVFRALGIKSVEQIAVMTESIMGRVQLPGVRDIKAQAAAFLEARADSAVAEKLTAQEGKIAALEEQLSAAMELLKQQAEAAKAEKPAKKREKEAA